MPRIQTNSPYKGSGALTREQFLYYEMRITAKLVAEGLSEGKITQRIIEGNLFQYPTEKMISTMCHTCLQRLSALNDSDLVFAIANQPSDTAKQICLYAMMKQYRIIWDFMITVIGEKYRTHDSSFSQMDLRIFLMQLQEQDDYVASWSAETISKIRSVIMRILIENEYVDSINPQRLNAVWLNPMLENAMRTANDVEALSAFNCFL